MCARNFWIQSGIKKLTSFSCCMLAWALVWLWRIVSVEINLSIPVQEIEYSECHHCHETSSAILPQYLLEFFFSIANLQWAVLDVNFFPFSKLPLLLQVSSHLNDTITCFSVELNLDQCFYVVQSIPTPWSNHHHSLPID